MAKRMSGWDHFAYFLLVIGAVNWGLVGISRLVGNNFDLIASWLPGWLANSIFALVGVAGFYAVYTWVKLASR